MKKLEKKKKTTENTGSTKNLKEEEGSQKNLPPKESGGGSKTNLGENPEGGVLYQRPETQGNHSQSQGKRNKPNQTSQSNTKTDDIV